MGKNNFKAKEATSDANYAQGIGTGGQDFMNTGVQQQAQGFGNLQDTYGQQKNFAQMLQSAAAGTGGPTLADQAVKDVTARNNANAAGFAAGAKGLNPALAARQALMAQAGNNQQAAGQAAQTHIQEQQAARAQLGGALAGQAGTAGGMTSAGQGAVATGGGLANQSNANLVSSRGAANQVNADVAKQNAGAINGALSGVMNAAGAAFGLAEGGVVPGEPEGTQSDETSIALAKGGLVPPAPALPSGTHGMPTSRRSFAAQVAHHLAREYFAEGGEAHGSYDFPAMDLREAKSHKFAPMDVRQNDASYVPHNRLDVSPTSGTTAASKEGEDSLGRQKPSINRAEGGEIPEETSFERQLRERQEARDRSKEKETASGMKDLENATPQMKAYGGDVSEQSYDETDDDPEADNQPDTDQATDEGEAQEHGYYADGGEASDESAGMSTGRSPSAMVKADAAMHPMVQQHPSMFQGMADRFNSSPMGKLLNPGSDQAAAARGVNVYGAAGAPPGAQPARAPNVMGGGRFNFEAGGPVPGRAKVDGNSLKNDTVPAQLSPGEVVLPRTISHDPAKAKAFVEHLMQHGGNGHAALKDIKKRKV